MNNLNILDLSSVGYILIFDDRNIIIFDISSIKNPI